MKLLLYVSFIVGCWSLAVPLQKPLKEHVENLSWETSDCTSNAGNETVCIKADFNAITDPQFGTSTQYCGYVSFKSSNGNQKLFFWLVMSDTEDPDPQKNPVVIWMNGGPGASSLLGLWDQWGPRLFDHSVTSPVQFKDNPNSVTKKMSWIFLEQPIGTGYSTGGKAISDTDAVAEDLSYFIDLILRKTFSKGGQDITLLGRPLHIAGESYAGHYIPAIGSNLVKNNKHGPLNLKSLWIGNAFIDDNETAPGLYELLCSPSASITLTDDAAALQEMCTNQQNQIPLCSAAIQKCRDAPPKGRLAACSVVGGVCEPIGPGAWSARFSVNPYFAVKPLSEIEAQLGYYRDPMMKFLNDPARKTSFGIDKSTTWHWHSSAMINRFDKSGDTYRSFAPEIQDILNAGLDFMLYAGDKDLVVPFTAVKAVAKRISWTELETDPNYVQKYPLKQDRFRACINQKEILYGAIRNQGGPPYANYVRAGHFYYATIMDSGHMINEFNPANAAHLFNVWVFSRDVLGECVV